MQVNYIIGFKKKKPWVQSASYTAKIWSSKLIGLNLNIEKQIFLIEIMEFYMMFYCFSFDKFDIRMKYI